MISPLHLQIIKQVFKRNITKCQKTGIGDLDLYLNIELVEEELEFMQEFNLVKLHRSNDEISNIGLTQKGREYLTVVLTGGAYDLIHNGHIQTLKEAASLGNFLVVVVARDVTVEKRKRLPVHNEKQRKDLLNELKIVNLAILGNELDHMKVVKDIKPDIIAIGSDQDHRIRQIKNELSDLHLSTQIVRLESNLEGMSTTEVITEILERYV